MVCLIPQDDSLQNKSSKHLVFRIKVRKFKIIMLKKLTDKILKTLIQVEIRERRPIKNINSKT